MINAFEVKRYDFSSNLYNEIHNLHYAKDLWPIVYILSDGAIKEAYVGETTDTYSRMSIHLNNNTKKKLTAVHLITSKVFNKSATLDIESNLIKYLAADGQYKLINGNIGLANHNYYQKKEVYWDIFKCIWDELRADGVSKHSIEYIDNSDLFKYSPYKNLTDEQRNGLLVLLSNLLNDDYRNFVVEGGAGTGKTILAIFIFKLLNTDAEDFNFKEFGEDESEFIQLIKDLKVRYPNPKMALVVPMASFRNTLKKVFKNIRGLNAKMVIGPAAIVKEKYDIVVVDESHRLRRRVNLGTYFGAFDVVCKKLELDRNTCSELDWILKQSHKSILFYDENQSIKPSDVKVNAFDLLKLNENTKVECLKSQYRVRGGNDYVQYVSRIMDCTLPPQIKIFNSKEYEFLLFDSIKDFTSQIKLRETENGLSRVVAGFSWPWISKDDRTLYDIAIEGEELQWNGVANDWINSPNAINEVGCIHTTQGYDLNYAGVIIGNEVSYNVERNEIVIQKENYYDRNGHVGVTEKSDLKAFIINIYKTLMLRGIKGTYLYVCDRELREYFAKHIAKYEADKPSVVVPKLKVKPYLNSVPLYDLQAVDWNFSELRNVSDCDWVKIPSRYKPSPDLFACTVIGEAMNKVITSDSICLFRKYSGGWCNGEIVLVKRSNRQDPDYCSYYTIREYRSAEKKNANKWSNKSLVLKPLTYESGYDDIAVTGDEYDSLEVIGIFECVL